MTITINIDEKTLVRLGAYAEQNMLETFSEAITSLLDIHNSNLPESKESSSSVETVVHANLTQHYGDRLDIKYFPSGERNFKRELLVSKKAYIRIFYKDGRIEIVPWNAQKFSEHSSVRGNLASGRLHEWRYKGIYKVEVSIEPFKDSQGGE